MAFGETSSSKSQRAYRSISSALASAVLEWLLIFMLFTAAILSFLITTFAAICELKTPCLFCSRLDHILGNRRLKYYWDLICRNHKIEISSLVLCHAHNKLVDVRGMCENCVFSSAAIGKSNAEMYKLLVANLGEDSSSGFNQDPSNEGNIQSAKNCSCCNEPWIRKGSDRRLIQMRSVASAADDRDVHLSDYVEDSFDGTGKKNGAVSIDARREKSHRLEPLSHVQYSELHIDSDVEYEVVLHDEDRVKAPIHEFDPKEYDVVEIVNPEPFDIHHADDLLSEKLVDPISVSQQSNPVSKSQPDVSEPRISAGTIEIGHESEVLKSEKADCEVKTPVFPELVCIHEVPASSILRETIVEEHSTVLSAEVVPPSSTAGEFSFEVSRERSFATPDVVSPLHDKGETHTDVSEEIPIPLNDIPSSTSTLVKSEECNLVDEPLSTNMAEIPTEELKQNYGDQTSRADSKPHTSEIASEAIPVAVDSAPQALNLLDLSDAYRLAVGNRGRQLSDVLAEQWMGKDSSRLSEDLRQLLSQLSASREYPSSDMSPRIPMSPKISLNSDELKASDISNMIGMQILQKRKSLERNESNISLDGSLVSEIEGESVADRLKRQAEHDKKLLSALYKELEEERSSSAVAANQSMAMITRLQDEKAALHMEALQCLRMMEEQAEYDVEVLQKTSDLLAEREKEVRDLAAELQYYRNKFPDEITLDEKLQSTHDTFIRHDTTRF